WRYPGGRRLRLRLRSVAPEAIPRAPRRSHPRAAPRCATLRDARRGCEVQLSEPPQLDRVGTACLRLPGRLRRRLQGRAIGWERDDRPRYRRPLPGAAVDRAGTEVPRTAL